MFSSLKHIERKNVIKTNSFHMKVKTYVDEAHNTHFDLQNSPYHTCFHQYLLIIRFSLA